MGEQPGEAVLYDGLPAAGLVNWAVNHKHLRFLAKQINIGSPAAYSLKFKGPQTPVTYVAFWKKVYNNNQWG